MRPRLKKLHPSIRNSACQQQQQQQQQQMTIHVCVALDATASNYQACAALRACHSQLQA
jgi:hypothetical protein